MKNLKGMELLAKSEQERAAKRLVKQKKVSEEELRKKSDDMNRICDGE